MKNIILFLFIGFYGLTHGQNSTDCQQLAIEFRGMVKTNNANQLLFEVSNFIQTKNRLYYYPGLILFNEAGDTIAKEHVNYYGIGLSFQAHLLELKRAISFPFKGYLQIHGSQYQKQFCEFPFEIESAETLSVEEIRNEPLKIGFNIAGSDFIIDINDNSTEQADFHFNITNEFGEIIYEDQKDITTFSIPVDKIGIAGIYYLSIWDTVQKKLLPTLAFEL